MASEAQLRAQLELFTQEAEEQKVCAPSKLGRPNQIPQVGETSSSRLADLLLLLSFPLSLCNIIID